MPDATSPREAGCVSTLRLILVPAVITLAITLLRLIGELYHWSNTLFASNLGGLGALVGIGWLVPIFGVYFALRLTRAGEVAVGRWRPLGYALPGFVLMVAGVFVFSTAQFTSAGRIILAYLIVILGALVALAGWPALGRTLLAYAYAARLPVAIIMFFAMRGNWGTHYDAVPAEFPPLGFWMTYLQIGLLPQLISRVALTVVVGVLVGGIVHAWMPRREPAPAATT